MKEKFTQGEWKVYEYGKPHWNNKDLPLVTIHYGDDEEHIVDTVYELADAHLIASAPDMYRMLDSVRVLAGWGYTCSEAAEELELKIEEIEKLLAKARGE